MDYIIATDEVEKILSRAFEIGFQRGIEATDGRLRLISQRKAYAAFGTSRVIGWVEAGKLKRKPGGNGKNSTVYYEVAELMKLEAANTIVIRK